MSVVAGVALPCGGALVFWLWEGAGTKGADVPPDSLWANFAQVKKRIPAVSTSIPSMGSQRDLPETFDDAATGVKACFRVTETGALIPHRSQNSTSSRRLLPHFVQVLLIMVCPAIHDRLAIGGIESRSCGFSFIQLPNYPVTKSSMMPWFE